MQKITKTEDIMSNHKGSTLVCNNYVFDGKIVANDFTGFPVEDFVNGQFGCVVYSKENDECLLTYTNKLYESCEQINCQNGEEFELNLNNSLDCNYPTFICHKPKELEIGFVSLRNDSNKYYSIKLSKYKHYLDKNRKEN